MSTNNQLKEEYILEKKYRYFPNKNENSYLEQESMKDKSGRFLLLKTYSANSKLITSIRYIHKDTIEYDSAQKRYYNVTYNYLNNKYSNKTIKDSKGNVIKCIYHDSIITYYDLKYDRDSLVTEESEIINRNKSYIYKYFYINHKLSSKILTYYECCYGNQPIFDRIEYEYDEKGNVIQECKITDSKVKRKYKGSLSNFISM